MHSALLVLINFYRLRLNHWLLFYFFRFFSFSHMLEHARRSLLVLLVVLDTLWLRWNHHGTRNNSVASITCVNHYTRYYTFTCTVI